MFIVKVPGINGLGKTKGCEKAGNVILDSLKEIYSNEQGKPIDVRLLDLEEIHLDNSNLELSNELIYKNALDAFEEKPKTVFLGGDHSISYSITKAFLDHCKKSGKQPCLIIFDAHPDCMPVVSSGGSFILNPPTPDNANSNIKKVDLDNSVTIQIPTHEEWLRALIEVGFPTENILLVGARNSDPKEISFLSKHKIKVISMNQLLENLEDICDTIMEFSNNKELYISIDIDVIDPAFAPATGYPESGGLTSRQFLYLIQRMNKIKNLRALDIVEINPDKDEQGLTGRLGAKILSELI
jgi:agmatinase